MGKRPSSSRLRTAWDSLRTSFWFVPSVMMVLASGLVAFGFWLDFSLSGRSERQVPWWVYFSRPDDARDVLSTILSSMITMTSLVFSVTIVVLSLAANQFGPRLIRNFMASPQTQVVLGTFVMTILYCLIVLGSIGSRGRSGPTLQSTAELARALKRLDEVRQLATGLPRTDRLPKTRVLALARFANAAKAQAVVRLPDERRSPPCWHSSGRWKRARRMTCSIF